MLHLGAHSRSCTWAWSPGSLGWLEPKLISPSFSNTSFGNKDELWSSNDGLQETQVDLMVPVLDHGLPRNSTKFVLGFQKNED